MMFTFGNISDHKAAKACITAMLPSKQLIDDKGYDSVVLQE